MLRHLSRCCLVSPKLFAFTDVLSNLAKQIRGFVCFHPLLMRFKGALRDIICFAGKPQQTGSLHILIFNEHRTSTERTRT